MKNKIVFINIFYEILEYACEFGLAYIVSRLVSFSLEGDTRQTVVFAVSLLLALLFITVLKHGLKVNISKKMLCEKQVFQMNMYRSMMKVNLYKISYGELRQRLGADTDTICDFRFNVIPTLVSNIAVMLVSAGMIAGENLILGVVLFALTWVQLVPVWVSNRLLDENQEKVEEIEEKLNSFFLEGYKGFVQIKLFQAQNWYLRRLKGIHEDYSKVGTTGEKLVLVQKLVFNVLDNLLTYGTYFLVGVLIFNGKLTVGAGVLIIAVAAYLFGSMDAIREYFNEKVKYKIALEKVNWFYDMVESNQTDVIGEADAGGIQTRKLSFTYDGGRVFNYSDIAIPDGRKVVLMGENGSGKSTLLLLLSGLLKPVAGSVRGTANVTALLQQEEKLGETCAVLLQEISRKKPVDGALFDSISKDFKIDYLNQSFDDLSGGQKKKFLLAVVMASKDRTCILDEPTNALDVEAVEVLVKWLRECDKTILVVSHDERILNLGFDRLMIGDICHVEEKLFWQTAKTINWSIIFQALSDLLLIALPTIVAALSGNMTQMLLEYDKEGIFLQLPFFVGALVLNIALPPFVGMLSALILFRQSLTDDRRGLASFLSKSLKTAYSIDEGEIEEKISGDMLMYRYTVLFMVSQPVVIVAYAVEAIILFKEMNSIIFGVTVLFAASFPLIRSFLKGTWRALLKKKESEYKEQKKNLEYIFYSANSFIRNNKLGDFYIKKMQGMFDDYRNTTAKEAIGFDARTDSLDFFTRHGSKIIIIIVGCVLVSFDKLAPGSLLTGLLVLPSITICYNYLQRFISYEKGYGEMYDRVRFLFEDVEEKEEPQELGGNWSLEINDINFGYTEDKQVIEHKNFKISQGEKLVISGANGSGKSTLAALVAGLYPDSISQNQITVTSDGAKKHTDIISLRKNIAYLTQDAYLFSGTIADNLSMASDNEELYSSVLSEISGNSLELSKEVEEAGANFSPGQQQKISLARALIKKAELVILDEPGNHLDKEGLDWLGNFLDRTDKAVVLISHDETLTGRIG